MDKLDLIGKVKEIYSKGDNIIRFLKKLDNRTLNSIEDILISYDFQAGSYIEFAKKNSAYLDNYTSALANVMLNLGQFSTLLEIGVGEATTLANLAPKLNRNVRCAGMDISWSRIKYAQKYLSEKGVESFLCTADLFACPFRDSSIDVVYTSHSIEPNGGRELEALRELYRITNKYLVLLEPSFELADEKSKSRMIENGYVTNLRTTIDSCGFKLIEYRLFDYCANPLNPTALYVIEKNKNGNAVQDISPVCPISHASLEERIDHFYCNESLLSYPKIDSIPCLTSFNAILTSKNNAE